jgi:membrane dipeptidase
MSTIKATDARQKSGNDSKSIVPIIDLHADIPLDVIFRKKNYRNPRGPDYDRLSVMDERHLAKLRRGGIVGFNGIVCVEPEYKPHDALSRGLEMVDGFFEDMSRSKNFSFATSAGDFLRAVSDVERSNGEDVNTKIVSLLGVEGGELIEDNLALLRAFYRLGLRSFGYVWNDRNLLADGYDETKRRDGGGGLSNFGFEVLEECNRLGIILDGAHITPRGLSDILEASSDPVIVSHASSAVHPGTLRPIDDETLRLIAKNGGVVGVFALNLANSMPNVDSYVDHLEHVTKVAGIDHLGLGFDFCDYIPETLDKMDPSSFVVSDVEGLRDHEDAQNVVRLLRERGFSESDIAKVASGNFLRVMSEVLG